MKSTTNRAWLPLMGVLIIVLTSITACLPVTPSNQPTITLSEAITLSQSGNIKKLIIDPGNGILQLTAQAGSTPLYIVDASGAGVQVTDGMILNTVTDTLTLADLKQLGMVLPSDYSTLATPKGSFLTSILGWLPLILLFVLMYFLFFRSSGNIKNQVNSFGRSRARVTAAKTTPSVTFADVAGIEEAKQDLLEVVDFLKNQSKFLAVGARIPKGILLVGPPGTGKTLLARAVAGQAGVPFFSISGSEFVEVYVGVGASRVRDLFEQAKAAKPAIIFIDEIDAVGRSRGSGISGSSHEEREQTLNQILTEMDGFNPNSGVIVLAATNRPDVLDPALLRPGRFDRRISLDPPDVTGRMAILKVHTAGKPLDKAADLEVIAKETHGFSGADIANLVNEAALLTARRNKTVIGMDELEESIDRIVAGPQRKSRKVSQLDKKVAAYHESGHALVARMLPNADPVQKVSIIARGAMGGYTRLLPTEERYLMTRSQLKDTLATYLGGHSAEELIFNEVSTGPHSDIKQATMVARKMITEYGMGEKLPLRTFGGGDEDASYYGLERRDYGDEVSRQIDAEVHNLIETAHTTTRKILLENRARLVHLAERLMIDETLEGPLLEKLFTEPITEAGETKPNAQPITGEANQAEPANKPAAAEAKL